MNIEKEIEKKEYVAPQMTVVEMKSEAPLLGGSSDGYQSLSLDDDDVEFN